MPYKFNAGLPQMTIHNEQTVLLTNNEGIICSPSECGLYYRDTRLVSDWAVYVNGESWVFTGGSTFGHLRMKVMYCNPLVRCDGDTVDPRSIGLAINRVLGKTLIEDIVISNYANKSIRLEFELSVRGDFADAIEVKRQTTFNRSGATSFWSQEAQELYLAYKKLDFSRGLKIKVEESQSLARRVDGRMVFSVELRKGGEWHSRLSYAACEGDLQREGSAVVTSVPDPGLGETKSSAIRLDASNKHFEKLFNQGLTDLMSLIFHPPGFGEKRIPAAGIPWFVTVFGRDSLIAGMQSRFVDSSVGKDTLHILGALQADSHDAFRDAEPGKIPHELRFGELAHFRSVPYTPYYGTADATPLYLILLHELWMCTGDLDLLRSLLPIAEGCLEWIDQFGDSDGDGFQEYKTMSPVGYENMGWKDSPDSIIYPDGSIVRGPKALCELQGYVFDAWVRMAEVYIALGNPSMAEQMYRKAGALYNRFNDQFWDIDSQSYALALDGGKRRVMTLASNIGHCLWSGIVDSERARSVVTQLLGPDMWSGWGVRTLSARHGSFNPYNYQTGSVWPHDNAILALGLRRYGFAKEAAKIISGLSDAARHFQLSQLPELFAGVSREEVEFPVRYFDASIPQAWAAGAPLMFLEAILGLQFDAPHGKIYLDPYLPDWMDELTLSNLKIGGASINMRVWRHRGETNFESDMGGSGLVVAKRSFESQLASRISQLGV